MRWRVIQPVERFLEGVGIEQNFHKRTERLRLAQNNGERERRAETQGTGQLSKIGSTR